MIAPSTEYSRPTQLNLSGPQSKLTNRLTAMLGQRVRCSEIIQYHIRDAIVVDQGIVLTADGYAVRESLADFKTGFSSRFVDIHENHVALKEPASESNATGLLLKKRGQTNYGHWLIELLIKHWISRDIRKSPIIIHDSHLDFVRQMHDDTLSYFPHQEIMRISNNPTRLTDIEYITGTSKHPLLKSPYLREFANFMANTMRSSDATRRKLFVTRNAGHKRNIANRNEVEDFFSSNGFDIIDPGTMPYAKQVQIFSEAMEIVGIMGAGMCNAIFSPENSRVGYISPDYMPDLFYLDQESVMARKQFSVLKCPHIGARNELLFDDIRVDMLA